ncbi:autotransporter assembly complex protein TamA [Lentibacter sp. XHP0401]|uniref:autotransporter assembly complex protein TamA n=1 Tax=Lentibacter sp. XHP0401 TaxID=2984334 RepID=UPI0021E7E3DB|nr:BamA/TamA family outer membrane protein [Lentibacter sp. XHP0401]MCV2894677.1 BamA/TamA family outer membrane protein [Lentibacter sp. XHP0401]
MIVFVLLAGPVGAFEADLRLDRENKGLQSELASASLVLAAKREGASSAQDILAAAQADYARLVSALYERGYYGPAVSILIDGREAANIPPLANLGRVSRIDLVVKTGSAFQLGKAEIAPLAPQTEIPEGFRTGQPAELAVIRDTAQAGIEGWRAVGFAKAQISRENVVADHPRSQLNVELGIATGPRVSFGTLNVTGESKVRLNRIRKIAAVPSGEVFDPVALERAATRLRRTGSFSSVTLREADALGPNNAMDVELAVVDAKPRRFGFGAELHSSEGISLSGFWLHRNLLGGAERFRIDAEVAGLASENNGVDYSLSASLTRPSTFHKDVDLKFVAEIEQLDEPLYFLRDASIEAGLSRYYSETLTGDAALIYRYSDVEDDLGARTFSHLMLRFGATWDGRNDRLNPTDGTYLRAEAMPYLGLSDTASGARGYVDMRTYRSFGASEKITLAGRFQFGTIVGSSISETPPDLLFLSGGSGTVRGHSYQSQSITTGGVETGGLSFVGLAGEVRMKINETFGAVGFYDIGYIGANSTPDSSGGWHSGAGIGLRYQTGIGPIRLDLAVPVTGESDNSFEVYVGIGQAF